MKEIIGRRIEAIYISETTLIFKVDGGDELMYVVEGDCCSSSYFSEVMHPESILGYTITAVEELETVAGEPTIQESDEIYGFRIGSDKPHGLSNCIVTFRNSSNGYYGGSCDFAGVNLPTGKTENMYKVLSNYVADWKAFREVMG